MMELFSSIPILIEGVTGGYIQTQIQMRARDLFTGIFHVSGKPQQALFFLEGRLISLYQLTGNCWENLPQAEWDETITHTSGDLRELGLPDEGLRVWRLVLETDFGESKTVPSLRASELTSYLSKWQREGKAGLALIRQGELSAVFLLPSGSPEATEGVLVSRSQLRTGPAVVTQVRGWGDRVCQVKLCTQNEHSEGWREYNLRISFGLLIQKVLKRYEELAGRFLVSDLDEQVNLESHSRGWAISVFGNNMSIRQYFETTSAAGRAYASLLTVMNRHIDSVVGKKMTRAIFSNTVLQLNEEARNLLQTHVLASMPLERESVSAGALQ